MSDQRLTETSDIKAQNLEIKSSDAMPEKVIKNASITTGDQEVDDYDWELNDGLKKQWSENPEAGCNHPLFMKDIPRNIEDNVDLVALQQLVFGEKTAEQIALQFKDMGNDFLADGKKRYKEAIMAYTRGLEEKCKDDRLNSILYGNRSQAHLNLQQYVEAVDDARKAVGLDASNVKAFFRGGKASFELNLYRQAIKFCEGGLEHDKDNKALVLLRQQCNEKLVIIEVQKRKAEEKKRKEKEEEHANSSAVLNGGQDFKTVMRENGVTIGPMLYEMGSVYKAKGKISSCVNDSDDQTSKKTFKIICPIVFVYDEFMSSDFIESALIEETTFEDHLKIVFPDDRNADWDVEGKYKINNLRLYVEIPSLKGLHEHSTPEVVSVDIYSNILLAFKKCGVISEIPVVHVCVKNSPAEKAFLQSVHLRR